LSWFRKKQKNAEAAPSDASPLQAPTRPEQARQPEQFAATTPHAETVESSETTAEGSADAARKRRRRGSRGGRGRKKPGATAADGALVDEAASAPKEPVVTGQRSSGASRKEPHERTAGGGSERRSSRSGGNARRKQPPRRAPLPAAKRELLISIDVGEQRVAVIEDGMVAEVYLERPERRSIAGNIYLGVVDNVLPGMEAAFVEIGLEKNGFLYVDEIVVPELEGKRHGKKIQDLISRGEQLLVQAVKDPMKTKGARLTTEISLPGRFLVFVPNGEGLGVSRRLEDAERQRLKDVIKQLDAKGGGIIVRTAAEGASAEDVERDLVFLQRLWSTIQARAKPATAPALVYQEAELPLRIVRDLFAGDFLSATIDHERTHKRIVGYLKKTSPHMIERVHRYKEKTPLFEEHGVDREIESTLSRRVDLPSGGYLVFDYAEAFTVIDVNTGRFVGSRSKTSSARLEDTITKNNLEAVKEVVRQLRLRDIGGIIVIDFIDMANPKNRSAVEEALRTELERDRTKTYVVEISPLGLVEMTRQNVTDGPREILTRKCPICDGDGIVVSDTTVAMSIERKLRDLGSSPSRVQAYRVAVHPRILSLLAGPGGTRLAAIEEAAKRRFFLVPAADGHVHTDHFEVLAEGKFADLQPAGPAEGSELDVKLVELGLHDAAAGVGKVDGVDVVVANAASLVGKKAKVVVGRTLEGQVFGSLVVAAASATDGPITFESEAEKPTRAPAKRKEALEVGPDPLESEILEDELELEIEVDVDLDEPVLELAPGTELEALSEDADSADEDGVPEEGAVDDGAPAAGPKKRTRRGSRGGRRRRKPAGAGATIEGADSDETGAGDGVAAPLDDAGAVDERPTPQTPRPRQPRKPKIHVPMDDVAAANGDAPTEALEETVDGAAGRAHEPGENLSEKPKPKTRRGSRGGRNRRKKPPGAGTGAGPAAVNGQPEATQPDGVEAPPDEPDLPAIAEPAPPATVAAAVTADPTPADTGYVPMSEWLDDLDR
jgi:ribonuclease G